MYWKQREVEDKDVVHTVGMLVYSNVGVHVELSLNYV